MSLSAKAQEIMIALEPFGAISVGASHPLGTPWAKQKVTSLVFAPHASDHPFVLKKDLEVDRPRVLLEDLGHELFKRPLPRDFVLGVDVIAGGAFHAVTVDSDGQLVVTHMNADVRRKFQLHHPRPHRFQETVARPDVIEEGV